MTTQGIAHFSEHAKDYEVFSNGSYSRIASKSLQFLPKITSSMKILDNATGTGIVTRAILEETKKNGINPPEIVATDAAQGMINQFDENQKKEGWKNVSSMVQDSLKLKDLKDNTFDIVIMNFAIHMLENPNQATKEMLRVLKPGGYAVVTTWHRSGQVEILEKACKLIHTGAAEKVFPVSHVWTTKEKLETVLAENGFKNVQAHKVEDYWKQNSADDMVKQLTGPFWERVWKKDWTESEIKELGPSILKSMTQVERDSAQCDMVAWVAVAQKM